MSPLALAACGFAFALAPLALAALGRCAGRALRSDRSGTSRGALRVVRTERPARARSLPPGSVRALPAPVEVTE